MAEYDAPSNPNKNGYPIACWDCRFWSRSPKEPQKGQCNHPDMKEIVTKERFWCAHFQDNVHDAEA